MNGRISSLATIAAFALVAGTASAQGPSAPPTPAPTSTTTQGAQQAAPAVEPEVVWLRQRVEQLEAQLASMSMSMGNCRTSGGQGQTMRQGPPTRHGEHPMPQSPPAGPPPGTVPTHPQPMPPGEMPPHM